MRRAVVVVDLGFGDSGKGIVTDALARARGATAVVRFNGGAQAGHNVVLPDGRHHTFAQLSSGTFVPGVRTYLSRHVVVHPPALAAEARAIPGVRDALERVIVSGEARVVTPFHQAACRLRELARGRARHGSCGVGVGEVMRDELVDPTGVVRMRHLRDARTLRDLLERARERLRASLNELEGLAGEEEARVFTQPVDRWLAALPNVEILDEDRFARSLAAHDEVVFEGAQGVLLDEWRGFHPYTTWSTCTFDNALELIDGGREITRLGVIRTYATRHGAGPFPTERADLDLPEPHNTDGPWQGGFRRGDLDLVLLRYAVAACSGIDGLAVTHLDAPVSRVCVGYEGQAPALGPFRDLEHQSRLTELLLRARPRTEKVASIAELAAEAVGAPLLLTSHGPTHQDVMFRYPWRSSSSAAIPATCARPTTITASSPG